MWFVGGAYIGFCAQRSVIDSVGFFIVGEGSFERSLPWLFQQEENLKAAEISAEPIT